MSFTLNSLQTTSQILILVGVILGGLGAFGNYYYGKLLGNEAINKAALEKNSVHSKKLSDAAILGKYHFAYESFLMMKLDKKDAKGYEENTFSVFLSLLHKFKIPAYIINSVNSLSEKNDANTLLMESGNITRSIYDYLSVNSDPTYAYLYVLAISKDTYLKLLENGFPKKTLDIYEASARKQATNLNLPDEVVNSIISTDVDYEDLIKLIKNPLHK